MSGGQSVQQAKGGPSGAPMDINGVDAVMLGGVSGTKNGSVCRP